MQLLGKIICARAIALSRRVNEELLKPISQWLDDPDWMKRFEIREDDIPNWAAYKRRQRKWSRQKKWLAAERLRTYRQEILRKRKFRNEIGWVVGRAGPREYSGLQLDPNFISPIISPFSPVEQHKAETRRQFHQALSLSISDLLPWKLLLTIELPSTKNTKRFNDLKTWFPENHKKDRASKLLHLLQMDKEGECRLSQDEPFSEITIESLKRQTEAAITITDQQGQNYHLDWHGLTDSQRNKVIADIKANKIICKQSQGNEKP